MAVDEIYIGKNVSSMTESPSFLPYGRVILDVGTDSSGNTLSYTSSLSNYSASTHRTLYCECWWGSQTMADNILATVGNYTYQPFDADGALMDMSVEMGDAVTVNGLFSAINSRTYHINALSSNTISAPEDEEIDHEYPYETVADRSVTRTNATTKAELTVMSTEIQSKISSSQAQSLINQTISNITLSVTSGESGSKISLTSGSITIESSQVDITANAINLNTATISGTLTATNIDASTISVDTLLINGKSIGSGYGSGQTHLNTVYASTGAFTYGLFNAGGYLTFAESQGYNVTLSSSGASAVTSSGTVSSTWANIIAGGSGTAKWG